MSMIYDKVMAQNWPQTDEYCTWICIFFFLHLQFKISKTNSLKKLQQTWFLVVKCYNILLNPRNNSSGMPILFIQLCPEGPSQRSQTKQNQSDGKKKACSYFLLSYGSIPLAMVSVTHSQLCSGRKDPPSDVWSGQ